MKYNPKIHNRQSIRLKGWDYSKAGLYYITIIVQNRLHLFGHIKNGVVILNDAGMMVEKWYFEMGNKYPNIKCDEHVVMPDHFHCIIEIVGNDSKIRNVHNTDAHATDAHVLRDAHAGTSLRGRPDNVMRPDNTESEPIYGIDNKKYNASLFDMMDWFKTMTTNGYIRGVKNNNWQRFEKRLWQLRYYDHIIRNENDYFRISKYIINNPVKWEEDRFNNG